MAEEKKLLPSQQIVQDYLDALTEEMRYKACRGKVRQDLKKRVFPHLKPEQKQKYAEDEKAFDNWLTGALKNQRKFVIQPEKGRKDKPKKKVGDPNCFTKENVAKKNQQQNIKDSKARHEAKNPKRMAKFHGTETKAKWQKKYQTSEGGRRVRGEYYKNNKAKEKEKRQVRRQQELELALVENPNAMTPNEIKGLVEKVFHCKGFIADFGGKFSLMELLNKRKIITYFGLCKSTDRLEYERFRWLVTRDFGYRTILEWDQEPLGTDRVKLAEAKNLLGFKTIVLYKKGLSSGMEAYMVERAFQSYQEHMELGHQRLNRVSGAGHPYRDREGVYQVFLTYASSDIFEKFRNLKIMN